MGSGVSVHRFDDKSRIAHARPHVSDPDLMERLRLVEGERFARGETEPHDANTGRSARALYAAYRERYEELLRSSDPGDVEYAKEQLSEKGSTSIVIYGEGGWDRYFVRGDGTVWFSAHHGGLDVEQARGAGFPIFR